MAAAVLLALAAWLLWRWRTEGGFDFRDFFATFRHADWRWLALAVAIMILSYYGRAIRWAVLMEPLQTSISLWSLFQATAIGYTAIILLGRPGELVRPYLIAARAGVPFSSQIAAWVLERIYDTLLVLAIFGFALAVVTSEERRTGPILDWALRAGGWAAGITATVCLAVLFALHRWSGRLRERLAPLPELLAERHQERARRFLDALIRGFGSIRSASAVARLLGWSVAEWIVITTGYLAVFQAFPETAALSIGDILIFMGFVSFGSIVQIPGIGGGIQMAAAVVLVELFGLGLEAAAGIAVAVWGAGIAGIVPFGLLLAFHQGLQWGKLRHLKEQMDS